MYEYNLVASTYSRNSDGNASLSRRDSCFFWSQYRDKVEPMSGFLKIGCWKRTRALMIGVFFFAWLTFRLHLCLQRAARLPSRHSQGASQSVGQRASQRVPARGCQAMHPGHNEQVSNKAQS